MKRSKSFYESLLEKYRGVADDVEQGEKLAIDIDGYRWAKCVNCGKIATIEYFANCGFEGNINQGQCRECVVKQIIKEIDWLNAHFAEKR